jgi:hypothetical protein
LAEIYARRQKLTDETIGYAHSLKTDAMALLGKHLQATEKATGGEHGGRKEIDGSRKEPSNQTLTLKEHGLDKKLSADAQLLADLSV